MDTDTVAQPAGVRLRKRLKIDLACEVCRRRKVKCDGGRPACGNCLKRPALRNQCLYASGNPEHATSSSLSTIFDAGDTTASELAPGRRTIRQQTSVALEPPIVLSNGVSHEQLMPPQAAPIFSDSHTDRHSSANNEHFGNGSSSAFTGEIKAAIDARSGQAACPQSPTVAPMVDVSLFPSLQDETVTDSLADKAEYELPSRKRADHLVNAYWSLMDPLFPILNKPQFMRSYAALFAGTSIGTNERIFVSTLNAMLALSVQLEETLDRNERERLSGKYFQRAHALLQLPIWETGSIELIQCLLLMSQYLQCTNKPHQTWMVVGSAVRIAQGLGLHLPAVWDNFLQDENTALKHRVWQCCIMMDRVICVAHGRPAMFSESMASVVVDTYRHADSQVDTGSQLPHSDFVARALELYEVTHHAVHKCFPPPRSDNSDAIRTGLLDASPTEEKLSLVLKVDGYLNRWKNSLSTHLMFGNPEHPRDNTFARQATILHLRFLHSRILLFRPMLARSCLNTKPENCQSGNLSGQLMEQCALECVKAARDMISLLHQHHYHDVSSLPAWWYRMFYTYIAAMVLAVSTLRTDLFPRSETQGAREMALMLFQNHEHLSESVRVCKEAVQRISVRIERTMEISGSTLGLDGVVTPVQDSATREYPDVFQDFIENLDYDSLFNLDSML